MRFLHTADLQLGARFSQFGTMAPDLRAARLRTLENILALAEEKNADALVIAGDIFEDNDVDHTLTTEAWKIFAKTSSVPVFLLPGNHDPIDGPGSVWERSPFSSPPAHVTVIRRAGSYTVGSNAVLLCNPLTQKKSPRDPSAPLQTLAEASGSDCIKVGVTHGSLQIEAKHQPDDHPIALDAATRAGLDYLAIGHWHSWGAYDDGKIIMPGTPEPDAFGQHGAGSVALVEIAAPGASPVVDRISVAMLEWQECILDTIDLAAGKQTLESALRQSEAVAQSQVIRVRLTGSIALDERKNILAWLEKRLEKFPLHQIRDRSGIAFSEQEVEHMRQRHPVLAEVLADLAQAESIVTGSHAEEIGSEMTLTELQKIAEKCPVGTAEMDARFFRVARELLWASLPDISEESIGRKEAAQ